MTGSSRPQSIEIREVRTRAEIGVFTRLPGRLAAEDPNWVEPLHVERRQFLSPRHNPFFDHADVQLWLAWHGDQPVGRISAQFDRLAPTVAGRPVGFFGMLAAQDAKVLAPLLAAAENWLTGRQAGLARGPFSLSINQSCGLLIDGHDKPPFVMTEHDPPWLGRAVEHLGYARAQDLVAYHFDVGAGLPDRPRRIARRNADGLLIRPLDMRRYRDEISAVTSLFNDAWIGNWGFCPLTEAETETMARQLRPILDPELVRIAEIGGMPAGFIVMLPNVNEALAGLDGRLLPFGWARLLWRLRVAGLRTARVPLMGVRHAVAETVIGKALPLLMIYALEERARQRGIELIELSWLLADNWPVRRVVEQLGGRLAKTWRLYEKPL